MKSATELYHSKFVTDPVCIIGITRIPLGRGLCGTVDYVKTFSTKELLKLAATLGWPVRSAIQARDIVQREVQRCWYVAKGAEPPPNPTPAQPSEPGMSDQGETPQAAPSESPRGARPFCRGLVKNGLVEPDQLLAKVKEQFPNVAFKLGDVMWILRDLKVIPHTKTKGKGNLPPAETPTDG